MTVNAVSQKIRKLTGARTRLVWLQQQKEANNYYANTTDFALMGLDTDDGKGERRS